MNKLSASPFEIDGICTAIFENFKILGCLDGISPVNSGQVAQYG
jgi:hypothetical protein